MIARGLHQLGPRFDPKLSPEELDRGRELTLDRHLVARPRERPEQQDVRVLVERCGGDQAGRELHRLPGIAGREPAQRSLPQDRLAQRLEATTLPEQPR